MFIYRADMIAESFPIGRIADKDASFFFNDTVIHTTVHPAYIWSNFMGIFCRHINGLVMIVRACDGILFLFSRPMMHWVFEYPFFYRI